MSDGRYLEDPMPFVDFLREHVATYSSITAAADALSVSHHWLHNWTADEPLDWKGDPLERIQLRTVDRICLAAGVSLDTLYPLEEQALEAWCDACKEMTLVGDDRLCAFCDGPTRVNRWRCGCGNAKTPKAARCRECFHREGNSGGRTRPTKATEDQIALAHRYYMRGLPMSEIVERLLPHTRYASAESCEVSLRSAWKIRGWTTRTVADANALKNKRRRKPERCGFVPSIGPNKGKPCDRAASRDGRCHKHHPDYMADRFARLTNGTHGKLMEAA